MANAIYPLYKQAVLDDLANIDLNDGVVKAALVDTGIYTYSALHDFLDDLSGIIGTAVTLANTTVINGTFDSDNPSWAAVTGNSVEAIVIYIDTGVAATSRLVAYIDANQTGLPVTPNGGVIDYTVSASGWFTL